MAVASKAPGVILPTVPSMPSSGKPTKGTSSRASTRVVKVPSIKTSRSRGAVKGPKIRVKTPKMPKDATALMVPKAKRIKNGKAFEFSTKRKPVI